MSHVANQDMLLDKALNGFDFSSVEADRLIHSELTGNVNGMNGGNNVSAVNKDLDSFDLLSMPIIFGDMEGSDLNSILTSTIDLNVLAPTPTLPAGNNNDALSQKTEGEMQSRVASVETNGPTEDLIAGYGGNDKEKKSLAPEKEPSRESFAERQTRNDDNDDDDDEIVCLTPAGNSSEKENHDGGIKREVKRTVFREGEDGHANRWVNCRFPGCTFSTWKTYRMERHESMHVAGSKFFQCPDCPVRHASLSKILRHDRKFHTGEKDYECKICEAEVTDIVTHMKVRNLIFFLLTLS